MSWEAELTKLLKVLDPQVVLAVLILSEIVKRSLWKSMGWSRQWFLWVPILLAFPLTWVLWGVPEKVSWQSYVRQALFCGIGSDLLYRVIEPLLKRHLGAENHTD